MGWITDNKSFFSDERGKRSEDSLYGRLRFTFNLLKGHNFKIQWHEFRDWSLNESPYVELYFKWLEVDSDISAGYAPTCSIRKKTFHKRDLTSLYWRFNDKKLKLDKLKKIKYSLKYQYWTATIKSQYKLSREDWDKLVLESNGHCMLNGEQFKNASNDCQIDHDHKTGKVRGLLCARCNHLLAALDDLNFKKQAENYLL